MTDDYELPELVNSGGPLNDLEFVSDGYGEFPDGYRLTPEGLAKAALWLVENFNNDAEDCTACDALGESRTYNDVCPVHQGAGAGFAFYHQQMREALDQMEA